MTREETKKCIEIMQAYVDGKTVGCMRNDGNGNLYFSESESPAWNWFHSNYVIKPQSMKVTEEEKILLKMIGKVVKAKDSNYITIINNGNPEALKNNFYGSPEALKKNFYFLNVETQEWEDWSER